MILIHRALLVLAGLAMALAVLYAVRAVSGKPHRARRAMRASMALLVVLLADALGRAPIALAAAERSGNAWTIGWTTTDVVLRHVLPVFLWGLAVLGRWRGWLADTVFAAAVLIAAGLTLLFYVVPLPVRGWPF